MARDAKLYWRRGVAVAYAGVDGVYRQPRVTHGLGIFKFSGDTNDQSGTMSVEGSVVWIFNRSDPRRGMWMYKASGTAQLIVTLTGCEPASGTVAWDGGLWVFSALSQIPSTYGFSLGSNDFSVATVKCGNTTTTFPLGFNASSCEDELPYTDVTALSQTTTALCHGRNLNRPSGEPRRPNPPRLQKNPKLETSQRSE